MREAQEHQWAIEAEQRRQLHEAKERQRLEEAGVAERERLRQKQHERLTAQRWWEELSPSQAQQLRAAVADPLWKKDLTRVEFDPRGAHRGQRLRHRDLCTTTATRHSAALPSVPASTSSCCARFRP